MYYYLYKKTNKPATIHEIVCLLENTPGILQGVPKIYTTTEAIKIPNKNQT